MDNEGVKVVYKEEIGRWHGLVLSGGGAGSSPEFRWALVPRTDGVFADLPQDTERVVSDRSYSTEAEAKEALEAAVKAKKTSELKSLLGYDQPAE